MSKKSDQMIEEEKLLFEASSTGRLSLNDEELLKSERFKKLINLLLASQLYNDLKEVPNQDHGTAGAS